MSEKVLRCVWSVESGPADVYGSDVVSVPSVPAFSTMKLFAISIGFGNVPAAWAGSTGVPRVHVGYGYSCEFGFVLYEGSELIETPGMECSSLAATVNRYPQSDSLQIFKGYASEGVFCLLNNPLGDHMVNCCGESVFFFASFLEQTLGRFRFFALKSASDLSVSASHSVKFLSNPFLAIAVRGHVSNAEINA